MSETIDRRTPPIDNLEAEKQPEQKESERYLKLARENPHTLTEEIKKNPKTEPLLRKLLGDTEYERVRDLNPIKLSEDSGVARMQKEIYSFVDIIENTDRNGTKEKFIKGIIDSIIIENSELAMKIIETKGAILKDMIAQIFSWEGLKQIAEGLKTSVLHLFSGDAYKTGKSLGELGLITVGSGAGGFVLKRVGKGAIQAGERVAVNAGKDTVLSQGLQMGGRATEGVGKVVQAPYNAVEAGVKKVGGVIKDGVKAGSEAIGNIPQVQKVTEPARRVITEGVEKLSDGTQKVITATKERAKEALALASVPILVGSKDGVEASSRLKGQIGAVGDLERMSHGLPEKRVIRSLTDFPPEVRKYIDIPSEELYARFKELPQYRGELGELTSDRILGYGKNAIIVTDKDNPSLVIKISQERPSNHFDGPVDSLSDEVRNHSRIADIMEEAYQSGVPTNLRIPRVFETRSMAGKEVLVMDKIEGQSYHTLAVLEHIQRYVNFDKADLQWLRQMNDFQAREFLDRKYSYGFQGLIENYGNDLIDKVRNYRNLSASEFGKFHQFLSSQKPPISIADPNGGNYMLGRDGNYYVIDFARTQ